MSFKIQWRCQQGTRTHDNRDCAGVGIRDESILAIMLDGSTTGLASGPFAREIARGLVDWFATDTVEVTELVLLERLRVMQEDLSRDFGGASASYVLVHAGPEKTALVLHAGDCLVGRHDSDAQVHWLLRPHTLANALAPVAIDILAKDETRHVLTRSFRSRRFVVPDVGAVELDDRPLLLATDGFWAELDSERQTAFIDGGWQASERDRDDRSVLCISRSGTRNVIEAPDTHGPTSLYIREASA